MSGANFILLINVSVAGLLADPRVTDSEARKVLYENAADLFGFDLDALGPDIERVGFTIDEVLGALPVS